MLEFYTETEQKMCLSVYLPTYLYISLFLNVNSNTHLLISFTRGKREVFLFFFFFSMELAHKIVGAGKLKICRADWQVKNPTKSWSCSLDFEGSLQAIALLY